METKEKISIHSLLSTKYPENEYALLYEVRDDAGFNANRSADAIAVNLWPSRGHSITGFEIKKSRADWLSELKNPKKAEAIIKYCNNWYLTVDDESIVKDDELPKTWGLLVRKGNRLYTKKKAPELIPEQLSLGFVASMMKRATHGKGMIPKSEIQDKINSEINRAVENERSSCNKTKKYLEDRLADIKNKLDEFKKETGIDIYGDWRLKNIPDVGKALHFILDGGIENLKNEMRKIANMHQSQHEAINKLLEE